MGFFIAVVIQFSRETGSNKEMKLTSENIKIALGSWWNRVPNVGDPAELPPDTPQTGKYTQVQLPTQRGVQVPEDFEEEAKVKL